MVCSRIRSKSFARVVNTRPRERRTAAHCRRRTRPFSGKLASVPDGRREQSGEGGRIGQGFGVPLRLSGVGRHGVLGFLQRGPAAGRVGARKAAGSIWPARRQGGGDHQPVRDPRRYQSRRAGRGAKGAAGTLRETSGGPSGADGRGGPEVRNGEGHQSAWARP